jgi:hypothetical protein
VEKKAAFRRASPAILMVFVVMSGEQGNFHELPAFIRLAGELGAETVIAKNLDVILKAEDDERRVFNHAGAPQTGVEAALLEARREAQRVGIRLREYALQPREQAVCEHNPLASLFFNWEGYLSPCITLSYAGERLFAGERVQAPCLRFGNICETGLEEILAQPAYRAFRQAFTDRLAWERQALVDNLLGGQSGGSPGLPPAPEPCRTCYYLYGI